MLSRDPLIRKLAQAFSVTEQSYQFLGYPKGTVRGTIVDVNDPKERGRVKVIFDDVNPVIPEQTGAGEYSDKRVGEKPDESHWIDASPAFKGKQPKGLIGKRVNISLSNGQYQFAVLCDVMCDPQILATSEKDKLKMPNNSTMTRLPIYEKGTLPLPSEENWGCTVIEAGGPYGDDWLCVCLKRNGKYLWVRHVDLQHGHAGGNDVTGYTDTGGDKPSPMKLSTVTDKVFTTSGGQCVQYSAFGTAPSGNPYGEECQWFPPPMNEKAENPLKPLPILPPTYGDQNVALAFLRDSDGFVKNILGQLVPPSLPPIPEPLSSILPFRSFNEAFSLMVKYFQDPINQLIASVTGGNTNTPTTTTTTTTTTPTTTTTTTPTTPTTPN
jgi:hypothetical protein